MNLKFNYKLKKWNQVFIQKLLILKIVLNNNNMDSFYLSY